MGDNQSHHQLLIHQPQPQQRSRLGGGLRSNHGEIVEVQGGHIVRSTGRKDRHSKVCTAKGTRDRRVRLSAHTAIQFYDVQDRLGYDRPSKAVDWLMKNAKASIDELAELPPWQPTSNTSPHGETSSKHLRFGEQGGSSHYEFSGSGGGGDGGGSSFLPPSLDSDTIADTIKSFFPTANVRSSVVADAPSMAVPIGFHNYPTDLLSRSNSQNQDLRLSLQSFQDPIFNHPNASHHQHQNPNAALFPGFDASQMVNPWNVSESSSGGGNVGGGYVLNVHADVGQSQFYNQRGPLQSINQPFVRAWGDLMPDNPMHSVIHPSSVQSFGFASGSGFAGFHIPARIQGEEEHDGISDKPSSASSGSHH